MFIKEAYDRRKKVNEGDQDILTTEQRIHKIGSIKNNKVNYDKDEQFFSKEDMQDRARKIKEEVQSFVDPVRFLGILGHTRFAQEGVEPQRGSSKKSTLGGNSREEVSEDSPRSV